MIARNPDLSPRGWNGGPMKYGASLGRPSYAPETPFDVIGKVALRHVRLDSGGYDSGGAYWGHGQRLYWAGSDDGGIDMWFRARDRDAAKAHVVASHPTARFYR